MQENKTSTSQAMQDYYDGNGKHPGGRPTKYNPAIIRKTKEYLYSFDNKDREPLNNGDILPTIAGLCKYLKLTRETVYDWIKQEEKKEFSDIISRLLTEQERILLNKGLTSSFNSNITKLMLVKHGYHDKQEVTGYIAITKVERSIIDVNPVIEGETTS